MGYAFFFFMLLLALAMIPFSLAAASGAAEGTRLFALTVLPSLFPFIVCTNYIAGDDKIPVCGKKAGSIKPVLTDLLAAVCGSPSAVVMIEKDYRRGVYGLNEASALCAAFNQAGPAFVFSALAGKMLRAPSNGTLFALSHYIPPLLFCTVFAAVKRNKMPERRPENGNEAAPLANFASSLSNAVVTVLRIGGTIVFFRTVFSVLGSALYADRLPVLAKGLLFGSLEMTNGLSILSEEPSRLGTAASSFLLSFGGAAVFIQSKMLFAELKAGVYFAVKTVAGAVSALMTWFLYPAFETSVEALGSLSESMTGISSSIAARSACLSAAFLSCISALLFSALYAKLASPK